MPKKSEEKGGDYYAYLDEGCAVEFLDLGIKFKQGEPHKIPALYIEDIDKDPNYGKCADGEKKLTATECQALRKKEMAQPHGMYGGRTGPAGKPAPSPMRPLRTFPPWG